MGGELYRMVRDGAPASWTPLMRLVAGVIADDARDPGQGGPDDGGWPWSAIPVRGHHARNGTWKDGLTERTGLSERAISRILTKLARAGYEMREQIGTDKHERPVFAYPGRAIRFRVPLLTPRECPPNPATISPPDPATISPPDPATISPPDSASPPAGAKVARSGSHGRQIRRPSRGSPNSATPSLPTTPTTSLPSSVRTNDRKAERTRTGARAAAGDPRRLLADLGADEKQTNLILSKIEAARTDPAGYIAAKIANGEGQGLVAWARRQLAEDGDPDRTVFGPQPQPPEPGSTSAGSTEGETTP